MSLHSSLSVPFKRQALYAQNLKTGKTDEKSSLMLEFSLWTPSKYVNDIRKAYGLIHRNKGEQHWPLEKDVGL